jgi:plastocyanin
MKIWSRRSVGQVVTATFTVPKGTTGYHCTSHPGMDGEILAG